MPPARPLFMPNPITSIMLEYRAVATKNALASLKASYHLFLRNQPKVPVVRQRKLGARRVKKWKVPRVNID